MFHFLEANPWSGVEYEVRLCIKKQEDQPLRLVFFVTPPGFKPGTS